MRKLKTVSNWCKNYFIYLAMYITLKIVEFIQITFVKLDLMISDLSD